MASTVYEDIEDGCEALLLLGILVLGVLCIAVGVISYAVFVALLLNGTTGFIAYSTTGLGSLLVVAGAKILDGNIDDPTRPRT